MTAGPADHTRRLLLAAYIDGLARRPFPSEQSRQAASDALAARTAKAAGE
jgi:hypothetical protein